MYTQIPLNFRTTKLTPLRQAKKGGSIFSSASIDCDITNKALGFSQIYRFRDITVKAYDANNQELTVIYNVSSTIDQFPMCKPMGATNKKWRMITAPGNATIAVNLGGMTSMQYSVNDPDDTMTCNILRFISGKTFQLFKQASDAYQSFGEEFRYSCKCRCSGTHLFRLRGPVLYAPLCNDGEIGIPISKPEVAGLFQFLDAVKNDKLPPVVEAMTMIRQSKSMPDADRYVHSDVFPVINIGTSDYALIHVSAIDYIMTLYDYIYRAARTFSVSQVPTDRSKEPSVGQLLFETTVTPHVVEISGVVETIHSPILSKIYNNPEIKEKYAKLLNGYLLHPEVILKRMELDFHTDNPEGRMPPGDLFGLLEPKRDE